MNLNEIPLEGSDDTPLATEHRAALVVLADIFVILAGLARNAATVGDVKRLCDAANELERNMKEG